jgi:hypothetical protein
MAAVFGIRVVQWRRYLGNNYFTIGAFGGAKKGDGIYVLTKNEINGLNLSDLDYKKYIRPFYKNSDISKYTSKKANSLFLLYVKDTGQPISLPGTTQRG